MSDAKESRAPITPQEIQAVLDDFSERFESFETTSEDYERARAACEALADRFRREHGRPATPDDIVWKDQSEGISHKDYSGEPFAAYLCEVRLAAIFGDDEVHGPDEWVASPNPVFRDAEDPGPSVDTYAWDDWTTAEQAKQAVAEQIVERLGVTPKPGPWQFENWETRAELDRIREEFASGRRDD